MPRGWSTSLLKILAGALVVVGLTAVLWVGFLSQSSTPVSATNHTHPIFVGDFWFCNESFQGGDCAIQFRVGDSVTWVFDSLSTHTVTECGGSCGTVIENPESRLWNSGNVTDGTFKQTFNTPGTFEYQCNIHPGLMRGIIIVTGPEPTLLPSPIPGETTTATPTPTIAPMPTSTPPVVLGDVNGDGLINPIDTALVLQFSAGLLAFVPNPASADVNGDNEITSLDAALILQFVAGLVPTLPV